MTKQQKRRGASQTEAKTEARQNCEACEVKPNNTNPSPGTLPTYLG